MVNEMTGEFQRVQKRTEIVVDISKRYVRQGLVRPDNIEDFLNKAAHVVYKRPGIEGHFVRVRIKNNISRELAPLLNERQHDLFQ